jgi:hypothetical protein
MHDKTPMQALAEMWVSDYGDTAPDRIREWARLPGQAPEIAETLERIAGIAELVRGDLWDHHQVRNSA